MAEERHIQLLQEASAQLSQVYFSLESSQKKKELLSLFDKKELSDEDLAYFENMLRDQQKLVRALSSTLASLIVALAERRDATDKYYYGVLQKAVTPLQNILSLMNKQLRFFQLIPSSKSVGGFQLKTAPSPKKFLMAVVKLMVEEQEQLVALRKVYDEIHHPRKKRGSFGAFTGALLYLAALVSGCATAEKEGVPPREIHEVVVRVVHEYGRVPALAAEPVLTPARSESPKRAEASERPSEPTVRESSSTSRAPIPKPEPPKIDKDKVRALILEEIAALVKQAKMVWESEDTDMIQEHAKLIAKIKELQKRAAE